MAKKVLIVDDDNDILITMKSILEKNGFEVTTEGDGKKAAEYVGDEKYDLILLDIMMPISGYEMMKIMRKNPTGKPNIIFVSIIPEKEVKLEGVDGFVQKPFSPESFMKEINRVTGK